jgi:chemotaxis protein MotA
VLSVLEGQAPKAIEQKLTTYLPSHERKQLFVEGESLDG